jgi:dTDP-4-amino-4,6-dideoxygalactose transaminase
LRKGEFVTSDYRLAEKMRLVRNFGSSSLYNIICTGANARMSELSSARYLPSLQSWDELVEINQCNYDVYWHYLSGIRGCKLVAYDEQPKYSHYVVIEDAQAAGIGREQLQ